MSTCKKIKQELSDMFLPERNKRILRLILEFVTTHLTKLGIEYWITGGTLLGALRHQGQIPWDDDVDICCHFKDYKKVVTELKKHIESTSDYFWKFVLPRECPSNRLEMVKLGPEIRTPVKIGFRGLGLIISHEDGRHKRYCPSPVLDIFFWSKEESDGCVKYFDAFPINRGRWTWDYHLESDFYPLSKYNYDGLIVTGPKNGVPYCDRGYPDWRIKAQIHWQDEKTEDMTHENMKSKEVLFSENRTYSNTLNFHESVKL